MRHSNRISKYWLCQIAGWGIVSLVYISFGIVFNAVSKSTLIKVGIFIVAGFTVTHFLRRTIKRMNWQSLPPEQGIPRLLLATIVACALAGLIQVIIARFFEYFGLLDPDYSPEVRFTLKLIWYSFDQGLFIIPWMLIYFFYHHVVSARRELLGGSGYPPKRAESSEPTI